MPLCVIENAPAAHTATTLDRRRVGRLMHAISRLQKMPTKFGELHIVFCAVGML